jgi:hypothetical protein
VAGLGIGVRQLARIDRRRLPAPIGDGFAWICALLACWELGLGGGEECVVERDERAKRRQGNIDAIVHKCNG